MALSDTYVPRARIAGSSRRRGLFGGGTDGNEQLTAVTAVILLVLFAILGLTIVFIGQLLWLHLFLGVLLVGPVALKLGSTGYRFVRYYTASPPYRRKGPPHPVLRMLGPFVILTTLAVFFTGLLLLIDGPDASGTLRVLHKLTFFGWLAAMSVHVLGHLVELPSSLRAVRRGQVRGGQLRRGQLRGGQIRRGQLRRGQLRRGQGGTRSRRLPGASGRAVVVAGSLVAGLALALLFLPDVHAWTSGGLHAYPFHLYR